MHKEQAEKGQMDSSGLYYLLLIYNQSL